MKSFSSKYSSFKFSFYEGSKPYGFSYEGWSIDGFNNYVSSESEG